jgi:hypothetical protein
LLPDMFFSLLVTISVALMTTGVTKHLIFHSFWIPMLSVYILILFQPPTALQSCPKILLHLSTNKPYLSYFELFWIANLLEPLVGIWKSVINVLSVEGLNPQGIPDRE